jgi:hypothetical protein
MSITPGASTAPSGADYDDDDYDVVNAEQIEGVGADDDDENTEDVDEVASDDDVVRLPVAGPLKCVQGRSRTRFFSRPRETRNSWIAGFRGARGKRGRSEGEGATQTSRQAEAAAPR